MNFQFRKVEPVGRMENEHGETVPVYSRQGMERLKGRELFRWAVQVHIDDLAEDPWSKGPDE